MKELKADIFRFEKCPLIWNVEPNKAFEDDFKNLDVTSVRNQLCSGVIIKPSNLTHLDCRKKNICEICSAEGKVAYSQIV